HPRLDQVVYKNVGHEIDRRSRVVQILEQPEDAWLRRHRQRDVNKIDVMLLDVFGQLTQVPQVVARFKVPIPRCSTVVEVARKADSSQWTRAKMQTEISPGPVRTGNDEIGRAHV